MRAPTVMNDSSLPARCYRKFLRVALPREFHARFSEEMVSVFRALCEDRSQKGYAPWLLLFREVPGLVRVSVQERRAARIARRHQPTHAFRGASMSDLLFRDVTIAARRLWRAPLFSAIVILTLALGIGANTAMFTLVYSVLLRPLALANPEQLVVVSEATVNGGPNDFSYSSAGSFFDWRQHTKSLQLAALSSTSATLTGHGKPERLAGVVAIGGLLDVLGVPAAIGRIIHESDENPTLAPIVVLSYGAWRRTFASDSSIVGQSIVLDGQARVVVGVMPESFRYPDSETDYFMPAQYTPEARANRDQYQLYAVGRLLPGATLESVRSELTAAATALRRDWPAFNSRVSLVAIPLQQSIVGDVRTRLSIIMGAVAFVLLIACANIGNLMLSRSAGRQREIAIHEALGAGRGRITRQLLTESILLSLAGGAAALVAGKLFLTLMLAAQATTNLPRVEEIALDKTALAFTFVVALVAGLFFGGFPVWQLSKARSLDALKTGTRGTSGSQWVRSALVVSELALAMVLLTGAGLLLRSFAQLGRVNPGIVAEGILTFRVSFRGAQPEFWQRTLEEIRTIPGVREAAVVNQLPVSGHGAGAWFNRLDKPWPSGTTPPGERYRVVSLDYFKTVGIPLLSGRHLDLTDTRANAGVVINQALARRYYPNENPIGKPIYLGAPDNRLFDQALIVGVVGDTRDAGLAANALPTVFAPIAVMSYWTGFAYVIRTSVPPTSVANAATEVIRRANPDLPIRDISLLDDIVHESVAPARWSTTLLSAFAALAFLMAALGVFGVLSYSVVQRTREIGIRAALGASPSAVRALVVRQGLGLVAGGVMIGGVAAFLLTRLMESMLYGVPSSDPFTFAVVTLLLIGVAMVAAYVPARRATRLDPVQALRAE